MTDSISDSQTLTRTLVLATVLVVVAGFTGAPLAAAADGPPPTPAAYFGDVELDGEPAPEGVEITAHVNGEERGSLTTTETGQYGGASAFDEKLVVEGIDGDEGAPVEFRVNGQLAETTPSVDWTSGEVRNVDLAAGDGADPDPPSDPGSGDPGDSDDPGDGGDPGDGAGGGGGGAGGGNGGGAGDGGGGGAGDGGGTGGAGDGGAGGGSAPSTDPGTDAETLQGDVTLAGDVATVEAIDVAAGDTVSSSFDWEPTDGIAVTGLSVTVGEDVDAFALDAERVAEPPADVDDHESAALVSYVSFTPGSFSTDDVAGATIKFEADVDAFDDDLDESDVTLYRYTGVQWEELPTVHTGDGSFEAETPGFSTFAVGGPQSDLAVTDVSLDDEQVEQGANAQVVAQVENEGDADGTRTITLTLDGELVDDRRVTVPAGETRQITFTPAFHETGTYEVDVESMHAGIVDVVEPTTNDAEGDGDGADGDGGGESSANAADAEAAATGDEAAAVEETFGIEVTHVVALVALLLVVLGTVVLKRR